jgi:hypothetical protein
VHVRRSAARTRTRGLAGSSRSRPQYSGVVGSLGRVPGGSGQGAEPGHRARPSGSIACRRPHHSAAGAVVGALASWCHSDGALPPGRVRCERTCFCLPRS